MSRRIKGERGERKALRGVLARVAFRVFLPALWIRFNVNNLLTNKCGRSRKGPRVTDDRTKIRIYFSRTHSLHTYIDAQTSRLALPVVVCHAVQRIKDGRPLFCVHINLMSYVGSLFRFLSSSRATDHLAPEKIPNVSQTKLAQNCRQLIMTDASHHMHMTDERAPGVVNATN